MSRRLESYFSSASPFVASGRSFLDLPFPVRRRVYEYVVLDELFIDLNYTNLKVYPKDDYPDTQDCRKLNSEGWYKLKKLDVVELDEVWELDNQLDSDIENYGVSVWNLSYSCRHSMLLVSRQIHQEMEAILYANTVFRVCLGQPLGFTRLLRMSNNAISSLRSLTLRLDVPRTEVSNHGWAGTGADHYYGWEPIPPDCLDLSTRSGKNVLKDWKFILGRLAQLTKPGRLSLRLVFCAQTTADAKAFLEPLTPLLPQLKNLGISAPRDGSSLWWRDPWEYPPYKMIDTEVSQMIQRAIQQVGQKDNRTHHDTATQFRYLDLPQELRFAILEYTDLVSPHPVQWRPNRDKTTCCKTDHDDETFMSNEDDTLCACNRCEGPDCEEVSCCRQCSSDNVSGICYCSARKAAWSTSCVCHLTRPALFSVSSQVRQDAIAVYYACNKILVTPYNSTLLRRSRFVAAPIRTSTRMPKIELSLYLSSVCRNAFQYIRWLEWILPCAARAYLLPKTRAWYDYLDTILLMEHAMTLTGLTFTINLGTAQMYQTQWSESWLWFETIILPMRRLGEAGLKNFFVHLPVHLEKGMREHHERDLERAVMGKRYNSAKRGKPEESLYGARETT